MKIQLELSEKNEGTKSPWWVIIDPRQNFTVNTTGINNIAHMVTGPFFSRSAATDYLKQKGYNFSKNAVVYCMSGHQSYEYDDAIRKAERNCGRKMQKTMAKLEYVFQVGKFIKSMNMLIKIISVKSFTDLIEKFNKDYNFAELSYSNNAYYINNIPLDIYLNCEETVCKCEVKEMFKGGR